MSPYSCPADYFNHVVNGYIRTDIEFLLNATGAPAGPILVTTLNGIDILGGMLYGFDEKSKDRSVKFMMNHMSLSKAVATFLYEYVRCGMVHEGNTKATSTAVEKAVLYGAPVNSRTDGKMLFKDANLIGLDVRALANCLLKAISDIAANISLIQDTPENKRHFVFDDAHDSIENIGMAEFYALFSSSDGYSGDPGASPAPAAASGYSGFSGAPAVPAALPAASYPVGVSGVKGK